MLPALKNAGVVDAGGQGWIFLLEGLYLAISSSPVERDEAIVAENSSAGSGTDTSTENIKYAYCTEFIVEKSNPEVNVVAFKQSIEPKGDCMLVIDDDEIVKVHIHTNNPGYVLERAVKLGSMINIKIDNMRFQHQSIIDRKEENKPQEPEKTYGFVAVCAGDGLENILTELGVDKVIRGGQTMNPSTEDIIEAVNRVNAKTVFVFPNNKNIIMAANQAAQICEKEILVVPTKSVPASVAAMLKFDSEKSSEENSAKMKKAAESIKTAQITYAVRDTQSNGKTILEGDIIGVDAKGISSVGKDPVSVLVEEVETIYDDENDEFITLYYGEDTSKEDAERAAEEIENRFPDSEVAVRYGGQPLYYYIVSVE